MKLLKEELQEKVQRNFINLINEKELINDFHYKKTINLWGQNVNKKNKSKHISEDTHIEKVLIEAAACGRAIITTDVPGCRDAIEDGLTGFLVPVRNSEALAEKMRILLNNPLLCRKMGKAGRSRAEEVFDINKVVAKHIEIYAELLGRVKT